MNAKTIKINVEGKTQIPLDELVPFQGDLKRLERDEYEKLRKNILDNGFSFTVHVWQQGDKNYIIDGHQRVFALKQLEEIEGYKIPKIPVSIVKAKNIKEAKAKVLAGVSTYGLLTEDSLKNFVLENQLDIEEVIASFNFNSIGDLHDLFEDLDLDSDDGDIGKANSADSIQQGPDIRSASDGVRQVNLTYMSKDHDEFIKKTGALVQHMGKDNLSDIILECVREVYESFQSEH